jgi:hypothetical protein
MKNHLFSKMSFVVIIALLLSACSLPTTTLSDGGNNAPANNNPAPASDTNGSGSESSAPANNPAPACRVIHEGPLDPHSTEVATSGSHIHVEWYFDGQPEYETILKASDAKGGRFLLERSVTGGWVWEYADCTFTEVREQVDAHIARRLAGEANNGGYVLWTEAGFFEPVK